MRIICTGGRGFIMSHLVDKALQRGYEIIDIDKETYAASHNLPWDDHPNYTWIKKDINDLTEIPVSDILIHGCAETHVCNSINSSKVFMHSNVMGTHNILELLRSKPHKRPILLALSTDEVYSDIREEASTEDVVLAPGNPYSASKACAENLITAYHRTYGIQYIITRSSNNYGERQYEEKLIPRCIYELKRGGKIPIHGSGRYKRDWLYVEDNISAIFSIMDNIDKCINQTFNIGANNHLDNLQVAEEIVRWIHGEGQNLSDYIEFIPNRLGQDNFYNICTEKLEKFTGWSAEYTNGLHQFI